MSGVRFCRLIVAITVSLTTADRHFQLYVSPARTSELVILPNAVSLCVTFSRTLHHHVPTVFVRPGLRRCYSSLCMLSVTLRNACSQCHQMTRCYTIPRSLSALLPTRRVVPLCLR